MGRGGSGALALVAVLVFVPAAGRASVRPTGTTCQAGDVLVSIHNFAFDPTPVSVPTGGAVCWTNNDGFPHTTTSDVGSTETWDSGSIAAGASFRHVFTVDGAYTYHCMIHQSMVG